MVIFGDVLIVQASTSRKTRDNLVRSRFTITQLVMDKWRIAWEMECPPPTSRCLRKCQRHPAEETYHQAVYQCMAISISDKTAIVKVSQAGRKMRLVNKLAISHKAMSLGKFAGQYTAVRPCLKKSP